MVKIGIYGAGWTHAYSTTLWKKPKYFEWAYNKQCDITFYVDNHISSGIHQSGNKYAWLVESRSITPHAIEYVKNNVQLVSSSYIKLFTHYKEIANLADNFYYIPSHGYWIENPGVHDKTKLVSMVSSAKRMCTGHNTRLDWVDKLKDKLDLYGRGFQEVAKKDDAINDYMFSVTIENDEYETYWTEKVLDCFVAGTIPVYLGSPDIGEFFNMDGIILLTDGFDINTLTQDLYYSKINAVKDNYNRAMKYDVIEDYMVDNNYIVL